MNVAILTENSFNSFDGILSYFNAIIPYFDKSNENKLVIINCDKDYCKKKSKVTLKRRFGVKLPYFDFYLNFPKISEVDKLLDDVDIIQISGPGTMGLVGKYLAWKRNIPVIIHHHTNIDAYAESALGIVAEKIMQLYIKIFYHGVKDIIVPSENCAKKIKKFLHNKRFHIIKRGIDCKMFYNQKNFDNFPSIQEIIGIKNGGKKILLYAGRISPEKNISSLRNICSKKNQLVFVGSGSYLNKIKKLLNGAIFIPRQSRESLSHWYSAADFFVFPSKTDTFGNVVLESMACGTPVIAHKATSAEEILKDGETGFLVDDFNNLDSNLCISKEDYNKMAQYCIQESGKYSWEKIYLQHILLYKEILKDYPKKHPNFKTDHNVCK